jgi:predicted esterase
MYRLAALSLLLLGCPPDQDDTATSTTDSDTLDTTDTSPQAAALAELSSGECPDLSASGTTSFLSSGDDRTVTVIIPEEPVEDMPVVFFFHGLVDVNPTTNIASGLNLQSEADSSKVVYVVPESRTMTYFGMTFYMWQVMDEDLLDLVLYDDLRTCVAQNLDTDMNRLTAMGFSGGALFATVLARERGDTLATLVEMSGGSDIEFSVVSKEPIAVYGQPANTELPALLFSGGDEDGWPTGFPMVDFQAATDNLEAGLVTDGHYTWRCRHDYGHTILTTEWNLSKAWALAHTYGYPSPYEGGSIDDHSSWCEEATAE